MTDADSGQVNDNVLGISVFDKILNTKLELGQPDNKHDMIKAQDKMEDGENKTIDTFAKDLQNKEQQEEDVPENFFDDFMNEDFIEGLNVVDTWEGDDVIKLDYTTKSTVEKPHRNDKKDKSRSTKNLLKNEKNRNDKRNKDDSSKLIYHSSLNKEYRNLKGSRSSPHRTQRDIDCSSSRRDPSKTQRDILRDKDKCEKDKNTKIIHEKLKVVETGLVPPGMEMEIEVQNPVKIVNKLEEGEIIDKEPHFDKQRRSKSLENRTNKVLQTDYTRYSLSRKSASRRNYSPDSRRERRRLRSRSRSIKRVRSRSRSMKRLRSPIKRRRSRSRSIKRRLSPRNRSRSIEKRLERRRRSLRRTRSRSLDFLSKYNDPSPLRETSSLLKRNKELFKEIDVLRSKLYANKSASDLLSPVAMDIERELMHKHVNMPNVNLLQHPLNNLGHYAPVPPPNQNFIPIQPVPPPHQSHVELDQQFFIGQQPIMESIDPYAGPVPQMLQNPLMQPVGGPDMQPSWIVEQSQPPAYFNPINQFNMEPSSYPPPICPPVDQPLMAAPVGPPIGQQPGQLLGQHFGAPLGQHPGQSLGSHSSPLQFLGSNKSQSKHALSLSRQRTPPIPVADMGHEEELFAKMFADNKITLSDYLSISAKSTDNSSPVDVQNKIRVISHCQEALSELTGNAKSTGKFLLRKSPRFNVNKLLNSEGLSPFKKLPAVKFQFTTYVKQSEEKPQLAAYLNRLMYKLRKDISFQEVAPVQPPKTPTPKPESSKESHQKTVIMRSVSVAVQTRPPSTADIGCQVNFEEDLSPTKSTLKKQSLAKLTPAQLLAQAEKEASPPPAPRWSFQQPQVNRRHDTYRDFDGTGRRNFDTNVEWSMPSRNNAASNFYN